MIKYKNRKEYDKYNKNEKGHLICIDCGIEYRNIQDLIIDGDLWELIAPYENANGGGILCANCILNRLAYLGFVKDSYFKLELIKD